MVATFTKVLQYIGFIFTECFNTILFLLIQTKASSRFGSYKYLMITFAVYSMIYGFVEILTQPVFCSTSYGFMIFVDSFLKPFTNLSSNLIVIYGSSYCFCISLLTMHFIFRYIAVCRPTLLSTFSGIKVMVLVIPPLVFSIGWSLLIRWRGSPSPENSEHFREGLRQLFNEDIYQVGYMATVYYRLDKFGNSYVQWEQLIPVLIASCLMTSLITTIVICAYKTFHKVGQQTTMSRRTRELNQQLFHTLVRQFTLPFVTMFIPVALLMMLPMFQIDIGFLGNICGVSAGYYPGFDALIAMVMIQDFRKAFSFCQKRVDWKVNSTNHDTNNR